jgi:hypothetical protein
MSDQRDAVRAKVDPVVFAFAAHADLSELIALYELRQRLSRLPLTPPERIWLWAVAPDAIDRCMFPED